MADERAKLPKTSRVHCNACRQTTNRRLLKAFAHVEEDEATGFEWETEYQMLQCLGCNEVVLRRKSWFSEDPEPEISYFPPRASRWLPAWHYLLPKAIRELLSELYNALQAGSLSLAMMGARAIIETAMVHKVSDQGAFSETLGAMETEGYLSRSSRKYLEVALDAGSASMHRAHRPNAEQMDTVMDIVENFLLSLFALEKQTNALKDAIPPRPPRRKKPQGAE